MNAREQHVNWLMNKALRRMEEVFESPNMTIEHQDLDEARKAVKELRRLLDKHPRPDPRTPHRLGGVPR